MTTQTPSEMDTGKPSGDDFTLIDGIGGPTADRLHDAGILTFAQLGKKTHEELFAIVKGIPGLNLKRLTEQDWPGQAREQGSQQEATDNNTETQAHKNDQHYERFNLVLLLEQDNTVRRTEIKHLPEKAEDSWAGWNGDAVINFVTKHANLHLAKAEPAPASAPKSQALPTLKITQVILCDPGGTTLGNVIPVTQGWEMHIEWSLTSAQEDILGGNWVVQALLESIGPGPELLLPIGGPAKVPLRDYVQKDQATGTFDYAFDIHITPGTVAMSMYDLAVAITRDTSGDQLGSLADIHQGRGLYLYG